MVNCQSVSSSIVSLEILQCNKECSSKQNLTSNSNLKCFCSYDIPSFTCTCNCTYSNLYTLSPFQFLNNCSGIYNKLKNKIKYSYELIALNNTIYQIASNNVTLQSYCNNECYAIQNLTNTYIQCSCNYSLNNNSCNCNCTYNLGIIYQLNPVIFNHTCSLVNTTSSALISTSAKFCKNQCELRLNYTGLLSRLACNCTYVNSNNTCNCSCIFQLGLNNTFSGLIADPVQISSYQYTFNCTCKYLNI